MAALARRDRRLGFASRADRLIDEARAHSKRHPGMDGGFCKRGLAPRTHAQGPPLEHAQGAHSMTIHFDGRARVEPDRLGADHKWIRRESRIEGSVRHHEDGRRFDRMDAERIFSGDVLDPGQPDVGREPGLAVVDQSQEGNPRPASFACHRRYRLENLFSSNWLKHQALHLGHAELLVLGMPDLGPELPAALAHPGVEFVDAAEA